MKAIRTAELKVTIQLEPGTSLETAVKNVRLYLSIMANDTSINSGKRMCFPDSIQVKLVGHSVRYD